jgi:hypothetical protein
MTFSKVNHFEGKVARIVEASGNKEVKDANQHCAKWGLIDRNGKLLLEPSYTFINSFIEGFSFFYAGGSCSCIHYDDESEICEGGKWGVLNSNGTIVAKPQFDAFEPFLFGKAKVRVGKKWGIIDTNGKFIVPPVYEYVSFDASNLSYVYKGGNCKEGDFGSIECENGFWGVVDTSNKEIVKPSFSKLINHHAGIAWASINNCPAATPDCDKPFTYFIIDQGKTIKINQQVNAVGNWISNHSPLQIKDSWGFINNKGEIVVKPAYDHVGYNNGKYFWVNEGAIHHAGEVDSYHEGGQWGIVSSSGKFVIGVELDEYHMADDDMAIVRKENHFGIINFREGKFITQIKYSSIKTLENLPGYENLDLFLIELNGRFGYINKQGKEVIKPILTQAAESFHRGYARIFIGKDYGYINTSGKIVWWSGSVNPTVN